MKKNFFIQIVSVLTVILTPMNLALAVDLSNTIYGQNAGNDTMTGLFNTFIGASAGQTNTSGGANTFLGYNAGNSNTTSINNTFVGQGAGWKFNGTYTAGDNDNTAIGNGAGLYLTLGYGNTFVGSAAGAATDASRNTGFANSFFGAKAGNANTQGWANTFMGTQAGNANIDGCMNTFVGNRAGYANINGIDNTYVGDIAGLANALGNSNTFVGKEAGAQMTSGSRNVILGARAAYFETGDDMLYINSCDAYDSRCNFPLIKGNFQDRWVQIDGSLTMVTVATPSDERYKKEIRQLKSALQKVLHLKGVSYEWDKDKVKGAGYKGGRQIGLIAQEVEKVLPELVHTDDKGYKTLSYDKMVPVLIEAVKEQQIAFNKAISEKDFEIDSLKKAMLEITSRLAAIESSAKTVAVK